MERVGYAVVGLGAISKQAVLPAFAHSEHGKLVAVVSGDEEKAKQLGGQYGAKHALAYGDFARCLEDPEVEAVYIATPPGEHERYAVDAARAKKHVLCEKPLAASVKGGKRIVDACKKHGVQLMTAYRKYYEPGSVALKEMIKSGQLGRVDIIHTAFTEFHPPGDGSPEWLYKKKLGGGGPLMDLGVYCVNTARWLVDEDPISATAHSWKNGKRYKEVEEGIAFRLAFKSGLVLQGSTSFGSALASFVQVHGEKGWASLSPAFAFEEERRLQGKIEKQWFAKEYSAIDEFALEIDAFASSIRGDSAPEPDGVQGLRDLSIIEAIYRSASTERTVRIKYPKSKSKRRKK
jgi:predicted dehydrogenase